MLTGVMVPETPTHGEQAVRAVVRQVQDGWNTGDSAAFSAPFAADADYVPVRTATMRTGTPRSPRGTNRSSTLSTRVAPICIGSRRSGLSARMSPSSTSTIT